MVSTSSPSRSTRGAAILVADDHQPLRQAIAANLGVLGYHNLAEAEDGQVDCQAKGRKPTLLSTGHKRRHPLAVRHHCRANVV